MNALPRKIRPIFFSSIMQRVGLGLYQPYLDNLSCSGLPGAYGWALTTVSFLSSGVIAVMELKGAATKPSYCS